MSDFTLVTCPEGQRESQHCVHGKFRSFFVRISDFLNKGGCEFELSTVRFDEQPGFFILTLPLDLCELGNMGARSARTFRRRMARFCAEKNCGRLVVPLNISGALLFQGIEFAAFTGNYLYRSLMLDIIREICLKRGIEAHRADIAVICDQKTELLFSILYMLLPQIKYMTVATAEESPIEQKMGEIYGEYGVSVRVTDSIESIKGADLIINLSSSPLQPHVGSFSSKAAVLNYGGRWIEKVMRGSVIINGLRVKLPHEITSRLPSSFYNYCKTAEFAEIILSYRLGIENDVLGGKYTFGKMSHIANEFRKAGCKITGFVGRHSLLKPEELMAKNN